MGCRKLDISDNNFTTLKVVHNSLNVNKNSSAGVYRYGFNGKEKIDEIANVTGAHYDFGARIYDSRLGRWLAVDPLQKKYPFLSPYAFAANKPTIFVDPDGNSVRPSFMMRVLNPKHYRSAMNVIKSDEGKKTFAQYATKGQARRYWGGDKAGALSKDVDVVFKKAKFKQGGVARVHYNKVQEEDLKTSDFNKMATDLHGKINVYSGTHDLDDVKMSEVGITETYAHESLVHAKYSLEFMNKIFTGQLNTPEQIEAEYSAASKDVVLNEPPSGYLSTTFQHAALATGKNVLFESFIKTFRKGLSEGGKSELDKTLKLDIESFELDTEEYIEKEGTEKLY